MVDPGWYIFSWLWMGVLQVCWDVHGAACTPSWVCCREALRRDRDLYSHSRPHTWLSSATRYFYCLIDNETPRKYPLWHGDQSLHYVAPSFLHFLPSSLNACMEFVCWLFDDSFFFLCVHFLSPPLRWSTSCVPARTHQDPPCAIWGPVRTSCSLTCSTYPSSCLVSIRDVMNEKHETKRKGTGKQEMSNIDRN